MNAVEKETKLTLIKNEVQGNEPAKLLYLFAPGNIKQPKKEQEDSIKQENNETEFSHLLGLPPQPTSYIKYSDFDCL